MNNQEPSNADLISDNINKSIQATFADLGGGLVLGSVAFVDYIDVDGKRRWATCYMDNQPPMQTLGLLDYHKIIVETMIKQRLIENGL